jgi:potassium voltage-gated channel Eag-related subfamily H protein 8
VKQCIKYIKKPLVHIHNASLGSGTFPDRLKIAKVIPLHKKGSIHDAKNYRPICVLPAFSKILGKLMYNGLMPFLVENNVIMDAQNGFRREKSTNTACQTFIENIQEALDKGLHAIGILFDLPKRMM